MKESDNLLDLKNRIAELEQEKSQLLKLVSHDVKSPFNKLFALSNLLQLVSDDLSEEQLDYLTRMEWVIKEGLTVVRNLMDLRAIENNAIELDVDELNLDAMLNDNIKNYSKQILTKKLIFESNIKKVTIWSDKLKIDRVLDHLVSNAVKFTPKKSTVHINLVASNDEIEFRISSNSGPLPEEDVDNLFNRNSPLSTRPTHGESALGNGLFIAQSFAQHLAGNIKFSQKGSIIEFILTVPEKLDK